MGVALSSAFFDGLDLCASIVGDKGMVSWTAGVICRSGESGLTLGSTNSGRILVHTYDLDTVLGMDGIFILPISFCKIALELHKKPRRRAFVDC